MKEVTLVLDDGTQFHGQSFGYEKNVAGEVVFNTAMMGYPESLTDPSYAGQMLVTTFPLVGNYGVPKFSFEKNGLPTFMESDRIYATALIVSDYSEQYSHWNANESLGDWLKREQVPGVTGIDTRQLTKVLREHGVMMGRLVFEGVEAEPQQTEQANYGDVNWVERVSCKDVVRYNEGAAKKVVLVDCGVKANIIRCLINRGVEVIRVPWNYDYTDMQFDGLFLANGPGDPDKCVDAVEVLKKQLSASRKPVCGICMGNQLLAKAAGATIYKLKYGHRSHNQPVREVGTNRCYVTSQNHGYAVDASTLGKDWRELFVNMNDGSNEGIRHQTNPWFSSQFHPEACSGPKRVREMKYDNIKKVLLLGSGALKIGEAGEFDYSGSQALKALREEGIKTVLINPNIATVQTSEGVADEVYFLPVQPYFVEQVIQKERPDGILLAFGGQTALNCGVELYQSGVLEKYGVKVLGTPVQAIIDTYSRAGYHRYGRPRAIRKKTR